MKTCGFSACPTRHTMPFVPPANRGGGFYAAVAARRAQKWVRNRRKDGCQRSLEEFEGCEHTLQCSCVKKFHAYRRRHRRRKHQRIGAPTLLRAVWKLLPEKDRVKHLSLQQCREYNISYTQVSRPVSQNSFLANLRHLCLRVIIRLKSYGYGGFTSIPNTKCTLYSLARRLATLLKRTVLPSQEDNINLIGQWPHLHRRASVVTDHDSISQRSDNSGDRDISQEQYPMELPNGMSLEEFLEWDAGSISAHESDYSD